MKKIRIPILLCATAALAVSACSQGEGEGTEATETTEETAAEPVSWGYTEADGPAVWGDLSEEFATCKTGTEQSPIDLPAVEEANIVQVTTNYAATDAKITDKGKTVQADFDKGFTMTSGDTTYDLLQVHFHTPSENTLAGKSYPMDGHFVHATEGGDLAVLGFFFEEGEANAELQKMLDNMEGTVNVDLAAMLNVPMDVYNFAGSLTTPPCSEGVNWHVVTKPLTASKEQLETLTKLMGNNSRPIQPMNDRKI